MRIPPEEHPLLCSEAPQASKEAREKVVELALEGLRVPAVYLAKAPVLSTFSLGRQTTCAVELGHDGSTGALQRPLHGTFC
jgi:actin-like protein 6A